MTNPAPLVLVVEDEPPIAGLVRGYPEREGLRVRIAADGPAALETVAADRPSVVLLDVGLPGLDGTEVCRRLREAGDWTPVLFVTARDEEVDRVLGLELGADDYVTKPFSPRELVARVRAVLRRTAAGPRGSGGVLAAGEVQLDLETRRARAAGVPVELTTTEFEARCCPIGGRRAPVVP